MKTIEISTKSVLKKAKDAGYEEIRVIGEPPAPKELSMLMLALLRY